MTDKNVKKRLGEILIEDGSLSPENLEEALLHQKKEGGMIGQILIKLGYITEDHLVAAVGKQMRVPYLPLSQYSINMEVASSYGEDFCRRHLLIVFDQDEKKSYLTLSDPLNEIAIEEMRKKTNLKLQVFVSTPTEIFNMLDLIFHASRKEIKKAS